MSNDKNKICYRRPYICTYNTKVREFNEISIMSRSDNGPLWQDDAEVTSCFLCESNYTIFHRRHHCRKCGRVVCGNCSEQTIKYFPGTLIANPQQEPESLIPLEVYKTCDECVAEIKMIRRALYEARSAGVDPVTTGRGADEASDNDVNDANEDPLVDNNSTTKYSARTSTRLVRSSTHSSCANLHRGAHNSGRRTQSDSTSDANLCPVCANNLLKDYIKHSHRKHNDIDEDEFESFKESHINDCLIAFDFNGDREGPSSPVQGKTRSHKRNKMLVYNMPPIPRPKYETIPNVEGSSYDTLKLQSQSSQSPINLQTDEQYGGRTQSPNEFAVGSVTSNSTIQQNAEKLLGYEAVDNECVICLEDLKPGDKVGRLECLCVFHYKCIKDWFNKKGYGECPVHFLHQ